MSVATPTVLPRPLLFPRLLPKPPNPQPAPLPPQGKTYGRLNASRNLQREMDDLSDEENELEDMVCASGWCPFHAYFALERRYTPSRVWHFDTHWTESHAAGGEERCASSRDVQV
jgi:hypothetical protein